MTKKLKISIEIQEEIYKEALRTYPEEACGFLIGEIKDERIATQFLACDNIQNELHEKDPVRYPRNAKTAYVIDPKQQEEIQKKCKEKGLEILAIVHSHPDHESYFSKEDKENAAPWGEPLFPDLSYLVVSVMQGRIAIVKDFLWNSNDLDFVEDLIKA